MQKLKISCFCETWKSDGIESFLNNVLQHINRNFLKKYYMFMKLLQKENYNAVHLRVFDGLSLYYACLARKMEIPI